MTRRARTIALCGALLLGGLGLAPAGAESRAVAPPAGAKTTVRGAGTRTDQLERQADINEELQSLRAQVSEASEQEAGLLDRLDDVQRSKRTLDARLAEVDRQAAAVETEARAAEAALDAVQSEFVRAQTQLALENEALAGERRKLRDRAVAAYIANPTSNAAELFLRANDMRQVAATAGYLQAVVEIQTKAVERYTARRDATDALRRSVEVQKDAAMRQRDIVVNRLSDLEAIVAEQQRVRSDLAAEAARHTALLEEVRERKADFEAEIDSLRAESNTVSALLKGLQIGTVGAVAPRAGVFGSPIPGALVTSTFGPRVHPIFGNVRMHDGVDFGAQAGTPIRAVAAGTVVSAGVRGGYGNATIIDHGAGVATLYAHQSEMFVTPGASVAAGQVIGAVGSTGFSTGPHLHFEVRLAGVPVDPLLYLLH
ncbi:MAG TPA: peptidoglycan DD-metalloendopeptidase family protein [Acidimicrobiales bacterium]|nr:peptidoglycan DD-metalloendopeptidase family protein [Acidimicrobiales bacterium]